MAQETLDPLIFQYYITAFEKDLFQEKNTSFLQFLNGEKKNLLINEENSPENNLIENLDKIEELIQKWEKEREQTKSRKIKREELVVESDEDDSLKVLDNDFYQMRRKKIKVEKKDQKNLVYKTKEIITIQE